MCYLNGPQDMLILMVTFDAMYALSQMYVSLNCMCHLNVFNGLSDPTCRITGTTKFGLKAPPESLVYSDDLPHPRPEPLF